jgi:uncharacterized protein DUF992
MRWSSLFGVAVAILAPVGALAGDLPGPAAPPPLINGGPGTKVGILDCKLGPSVGFVVVGFQKMSCRFTPDNFPTFETYVGSISTIGLDIGLTAGGALTWAVYAPTQRMAPGALAGTYSGVTASATVGVGVGANFLVGGSQNTVALQPWSVEGSTGLSASGGVKNLELRPGI